MAIKKKHKSKAAAILPKASLDKLKAPATRAVAESAPVVHLPVSNMRSITTIDPRRQVIGLGEDGKLYFWNFQKGKWTVALAAALDKEEHARESQLDVPQENSPAADPLA